MNNLAQTPDINSIENLTHLDQGPGKYRIGLLVLSNDYVTERDFINMRPSDEVALFCSRLPNTPECTVETLQEMTTHITHSTALILPEGNINVVAYSCTSGTAVLGYEKVKSLIQKARPGIPCTTPLTSSIDALTLFGADKLAVLTPYVEDVNLELTRYLTNHGKTVVKFSSFNIADNEVMARLSAESIYQAALEADSNEAEALFISCTAIRAVDVVEKIEQKLGKPVVTAVQALFWQSLRLAGYHDSVEGFGRLLRSEF